MLTKVDKQWILDTMSTIVNNSLSQYSEKVLEPGLDNLYQRLDNKIDQVEGRLDARIDQVEERLETKIDHLDRKWTLIADNLGNKVNDHERRIGKLEFNLA